MFFIQNHDDMLVNIYWLIKQKEIEMCLISANIVTLIVKTQTKQIHPSKK